MVALLMFGLYLNPGVLAVHPEDRLFPSDDAPDPSVMVVGIDDTSIQTIGHFPFGRDKFATVLNNLNAAGAQVVAFDVGFSESTSGSGDDEFASAIGNAVAHGTQVILAYGQADLRYGSNHDLVMTNTGDQNRPLDKLICGDPKALPGCKPVAELAATAVLTENDNVVRRMPMRVTAPCVVKTAADKCVAGTLNPLSFVAYRDLVAGKDSASIPLDYTSSGLTFGGAWFAKNLYVDDHGTALINFSGMAGNLARHHQAVSFSSAYQNKIDRSSINGKIVLVGVYDPATGLHDEQPVPPNGNGAMKGVEIHANMIQTLKSDAQRQFLAPEPALAVLLSLLLLCILLGILLPRISALKGLALTAGAIAAYILVWATPVVGGSLQQVPDFTHVFAAIFATYAALMAYRFLYEEREKQKVKGLFGLYLKPELVDQLARTRSADEIPLGGTRREITLLFVDIRGFTSMSEGMEAEQVLNVLDEYLEDLSRIVFKWDGTLDKYVGDEIMAIWNAPRDQPGHALLAVRAAWEMVSHMPELQASLAAKGLPAIQYGVGVNTGPASVGFMGSKNRQTYTAIGDTVNTAARFCGAAGPTQILIGQKTYEECQDYVAVDMVPGVQLKGKSAEKFTIYRVTAIREAPGMPWATVPGLETYAEVGVYHQQTMIGAGSTVSVETGPGNTVIQDVAPAQPPAAQQTMVMPTPPQRPPDQ